MNKPKLRLTTPTDVAVAVVGGAVVAFALLGVVAWLGQFPPLVPWSLPGILVVLAVSSLIYARAFPGRLEQHEVSDIEAVRALVIAKALTQTGALLLGGHVVYVLQAVGRLTAVNPTNRAIVGSATIAASALVIVAGIVLERACRIPDDDSGETDDGKTAKSDMSN